MIRSGKLWFWLVALPSFVAGCSYLQYPQTALNPVPAGSMKNSLPEASSVGATIRQVVLSAPTNELPSKNPTEPDTDVFPSMSELSLAALVSEVLARNPSLAAMTAAWQAASARYPQVTSLDDPMIAITLGPASYGSNLVNPAYRINIEQRIPYPGKLKLRGDQAQAEANAAGNDLESTRLQLVETSSDAFYEYFLVDRALAVNEHSIRLLEEFRQNAQARFKAGKAPLQDALQSDVELGRQRERRLTLEQTRHISVARLNTLLNRAPDRPLPAPPAALPLEAELGDVGALRSLALARRPDLQALAQRLEADQAALALAHKEFYPDFTPFAMYDRFMGNNAQSQPLATMVGMSMNLPVRRERRFAAVTEAQARLSQRHADLTKQVNQVRFEVEQAYAQVTQSEKALRLYQKTILPAAQANINAAKSSYMTGAIPFLTLLEAQRDLIGVRDRYFELLASYHSRRATLERAIGGPLDAAPQATERIKPPPLPHP